MAITRWYILLGTLRNIPTEGWYTTGWVSQDSKSLSILMQVLLPHLTGNLSPGSNINEWYVDQLVAQNSTFNSDERELIALRSCELFLLSTTI